MPPAASVNPLENINLIRPIKLWMNGRKLDRLIGEELDKRFATRDSSSQQTNGEANGHANGDAKFTLKASRNRSVVTAASSIVELAVPGVRQANFKVQRGSESAVDLAVRWRSSTGRDDHRRECRASDGFSGQRCAGRLYGDHREGRATLRGRLC